MPVSTASVDPNASRLATVHYDTPDLRLARAGVTLRRRTDGWHLTVPTATDLRFPLDSESTAPSAELTALILGLTRGLTVEPVARIVTNRSGWRLGASAGDHLVAYLRTQVDTLLRNDLLARRDTEDAVHQMRVAIRRIRGTLGVYRKLLDRARVRRIRDELRWLGRRLAPARDLEVLDERCQRAIHDLPPELVIGPVAARLTREFAPARAEARRAVRRTLDTERYLRLLDELDRLRLYPPLRERANRKARKELPPHIGSAHRKATRACRAASGRVDRDQALHDARKAMKRLRYAAEVAVPAIGKPADRTRRRAKAVTKVLGAHQDSVVARPMLRDLGVRAHLAGENGFTFGLLHGREQANAAQARRRFEEIWPRG